MDFKKMMLITILLLAFVTIGTVSAEDTSDNLTVDNGDDQTIETPMNNDDLLAQNTGESEENNDVENEIISQSDNKDIISEDIITFDKDNITYVWGGNGTVKITDVKGDVDWNSIMVVQMDNGEPFLDTTIINKDETNQSITVSNLTAGDYELSVIIFINNGDDYERGKVPIHVLRAPDITFIENNLNVIYNASSTIVINGTNKINVTKKILLLVVLMLVL